METKVCKQFGIDVPIFGFSHCRDVVAAVSAAGGMGVFGAATFHPDELEIELRWLDENCQGRPYGVNVIMADSRVEGTVEELAPSIPREHRDFVKQLDDRLHVPPPRKDAPRPPAVFRNMEMRSTHGWARPQLDVIWRHNPTLLVSALGPAPADVVEQAHARGMKIGGMTGAGRHAQKHIEAGAEIVVAAGNEGAGHNSDVSTMLLVPEVVDAAGDVPVLAAGGIVSGRQIAAAMALGAQGVWMGSKWLTTIESDLDEASVDRILKGGSHDTMRTKAWSGKPTRFMRSAWFDAWEEEGAPPPLGTPLQRMLIAPSFQRIVAANMADLMAVPVGQGVGQINERQRVRDVMFDLQQDYVDAMARLNAIQPKV
ncbi:MAG: NAD(P)H-dependent flavin oxidoreductase [Alphaproteobacteria bacterium]